MPLFPYLTGNLVIRERPSRYNGEPRYRRLSFVRPRSENTSDDWPVMYSSRPMRALTLPGDGRYYGQDPWQLQSGYPHAFGRLGASAAHPQLAHYPPGHPIHYIPAPALSGQRAPRQIEELPEDYELFDELDSEDEIVAVVEGNPDEKKKKKKGGDKKEKARPVSRVRPSGHSVFESSSDSDMGRDRKSKKKNKKKPRGRSP